MSYTNQTFSAGALSRPTPVERRYHDCQKILHEWTDGQLDQSGRDALAARFAKLAERRRTFANHGAVRSDVCEWIEFGRAVQVAVDSDQIRKEQ